MNKSKSKVFFVKIILFLVAAFCLFNILSFVDCILSSKNISMEGEEILRIRFFGNSEEIGTNTVSANVAVLDSAGTEIAVIERSWNGNFLAVDFIRTELSNSVFYFPLDVYGITSISKDSKSDFKLKKIGSNLSKYYIDFNRCLLVQPLQLQKKLFKIADFSLNPFIFVSLFFSKKETLRLHECEGGKTYGIYIKNGSFYLEEENFANLEFR